MCIRGIQNCMVLLQQENKQKYKKQPSNFYGCWVSDSVGNVHPEDQNQSIKNELE